MEQIKTTFTKKEMLKEIPFEDSFWTSVPNKDSFTTFEGAAAELRKYSPIRKGSYYQPVEEFFLGKEADVTENYDFITIDEIPNNIEFYEELDGYTYNDSGYTDRDFCYRTFDSEDAYYAFISFHYGSMDARYGFTKWFVMKFENNWDFESFLNHRFTMASVEVGEHCFSIDAEATYEIVSVYDHSTDESYESSVCGGDSKEIIESLKEMFDSYADQENMPKISEEQWQNAEVS